MTDHKFTDKEIIKALEICAKSECWGDCEDMGCPAAMKHGCHFYLRTDEDYEGVIQTEMLKDALDLINRQKAEIERLNAAHADMTESLRLAAEANKDMQAEIERLESNLKFVRGTVKRLQEYDEERDVRLHARLTANARTEAIKEFAERLKANMSNIARMEYGGNTYFCVGYDLIDNLVKEMMEGQK